MSINQVNKYNELMKQMHEVIAEQNKHSVDSYYFSFYQEKRYRISEKIEDILPEPKKLALYLQRKMHKIHPEEAVKWMDESADLIHNWDGELHKKYLKKAEKILKKTDYKNAVSIIDTIF